MLKLAPRFAVRTVHAALALMIALPLACGAADPKPAGSSAFKSGFSSQRSSSSSSSSPKGGFGSFGKRPASASPSPQGAEPARARNGGFGSFGRTAPADARQSDSALSRKLERDAAEARALRSLEERRAAQATRNAPPPPRYDDAPRDQRYGQPYGRGDDGRSYGGGQPPAQPPVIVRQDSGLGRVIAGAVIANAAANAHARRGESQGNQPLPAQPAPSWNGGVDSVNGSANGGAPAQAASAHKGGSSVFGTLFTLAVLALVAWAAYKLIMRARRKRAADKPNYSFERN